MFNPKERKLEDFNNEFHFMILKKLNYIVLIIFVLGPISLKDVMDVWLGLKKKKKKKKNEKIFCLVEKKNERIKNEVRIN